MSNTLLLRAIADSPKWGVPERKDLLLKVVSIGRSRAGVFCSALKDLDNMGVGVVAEDAALKNPDVLYTDLGPAKEPRHNSIVSKRI
jgi:hypothetical protein